MHDSSAESYAALFALTGSDSYLAELESRLDERAEFGVQLAILLRSTNSSSNDIADVLDRSLKFFPDSPELRFFQAAVLGKQKKVGAAREALLNLDRGAPIDLGEKERYQIIREALLLSGEQTKTAWVDGYTASLQLDFSTVALAQGALQALRGAGDLPEDEKVDLASAMPSYNRGFNPDDDFTEIKGQISAALEYRALGLLDPETSYGDSGLTVADRLNNIEEMKQRSDCVQKELRPYLYSQPPEVIQAFLEHKEGKGLNSAILWLERHRAP